MQKSKVVLVPFPFDDLSATKIRPAVILTEPVGEHQHVVLGFISSQIPSPLLETDLVIDVNHPDFGNTGLRVSSVLRLHRLLAVTMNLAQRELGVLSPSLEEQTAQRLRKLFSL